MSILVKLSKLEGSRTNPRRVKPERDAHRRLVASIRAHGLIEPLVVQAIAKDTYRVIAGNRRLAALRDVHRGQDAKIPCVLREADNAESLSLAENFVREPMHPLDEAEAFARLASVDRKGVAAIASEFGVSQHYVRQRMALSDLCGSVKAAFRRNEIGVGVAEAFASVPAPRQEALWEELGGRPHSAEDVRARIEQEWIPAEHALFDLASIEPSQVSYDLFGGTTLIAREAFMRAQRVNLRDHWTPDQRWLNRYTKPQLAHMLVTLRESDETADPQHSETDSPPIAQTEAPSVTTADAWLHRKKSELVSAAAALFKPVQSEERTTETPHLTNGAVVVTEAVAIAEAPTRTTTRPATWLPRLAKLSN